MLAACATLLGIDDGIPRGDAGVVDVGIDVPTSDAAGDVATDAAIDQVVAAPKPFSPLGCGTMTCNVLGEICCRTGTPDGGYTYSCLADAGACQGTLPVVVSCSNTASCVAQGKPGTVCCANGASSPATKAECLSTCPLATATIVCGPGDDELCASTQTCAQSTITLVGWTICK
jgi:hypothetical protein